jgi:hypothetical protein
MAQVTSNRSDRCISADCSLHNCICCNSGYCKGIGYRDPTPIPDKTRYLHYDNLGSIDTITDGQGNIVERMSYAAFGERRKGDWRVSDQTLRHALATALKGFHQ